MLRRGGGEVAELCRGTSLLNSRPIVHSRKRHCLLSKLPLQQPPIGHNAANDIELCLRGSIMSPSAIQDLYPDDLAHCFGCGRHNPHGHQLKSYIEGEDVVARFTPGDHDVSIPGFVYGGLLASLADCHAMATATAADVSQAQMLHHVTSRPRFGLIISNQLGWASSYRSWAESQREALERRSSPLQSLLVERSRCVLKSSRYACPRKWIGVSRGALLTLLHCWRIRRVPGVPICAHAGCL